MDLVELERNALRAEIVFYTSRARLAEARLAALDVNSGTDRPEVESNLENKDLEKANSEDFKSAWKRGIRLTHLGVTALMAAYDANLTIGQVGKRFRISQRSAANWRGHWKKMRNLK